MAAAEAKRQKKFALAAKKAEENEKELQNKKNNKNSNDQNKNKKIIIDKELLIKILGPPKFDSSHEDAKNRIQKGIIIINKSNLTT